MIKITQNKYSELDGYYWQTKPAVSPVFAGITTTHSNIVDQHLHSNSYLIWL